MKGCLFCLFDKRSRYKKVWVWKIRCRAAWHLLASTPGLRYADPKIQFNLLHVASSTCLFTTSALRHRLNWRLIINQRTLFTDNELEVHFSWLLLQPDHTHYDSHAWPTNQARAAGAERPGGA